VVLKFLSVNNIVIAPPNTGKENTNKKEVTKIDQTNKGSLCINIPGALILNTVVMKLIDPKIDAAPVKCKLKIAKSTDPPEWNPIPANGGYTVQPVPAPPSTKLEANNKINDGGINQKLTLFNLGNAMSGAPIINGTKIFPKPEIITGITKKKIIKNACPVINTLYNW